MSLLIQTLPLALAAFLSPVTAAILLAGLLPTYLIKGDIAGFPTNFLEIASVMFLAGLAVRFIVHKNFRRAASERLRFLFTQHRGLLVVSGIFLAAAVLATVRSIDVHRSLGVLKGWYILPMLTALGVYAVIRRKDQAYYLITSMSLSAGLVSWYGLLKYYLPHPWKYFGYRLNSVYTSPNYHALFVVPILVLALSLLFYAPAVRKHRLMFALLAGSSIINIWALILTESFGGFLGFAAGMGFLVLAQAFKKKAGKKTAFAALALFVLFVGGLFSYSVHSAKFHRDFYNVHGTSSLRGRIEVWSVAREIIKHYPVMGIGLGNYDKGYIAYIHQAVSWEPLEKVMIHAHDIFLDFLTDSGIVGLLSFLLVLGYIAWKFGWAGERRDILTYASVAALVATIFHGLVDTPYFKNDLAYMFWLFVALFILSLSFYESENIS
jgi:putative inorganic carbon (HCO3(-)) transporter